MVPERYDCTYGENDNMACSQNGNIPCWVSRPKEKEVMMWYMLTMSLVSTVLVAAEFFYVTTKITVKVINSDWKTIFELENNFRVERVISELENSFRMGK